MARKETPEDVKRWFQEAVRDLWPVAAGFRTAFVNAISEKPPSAVDSLARRLGCSQGMLTSYFPDLCRRLLDARRAWKVQERNAAIRRTIEALAIAMKGVSVPYICRAAGVKQMFLFTNFPVLYKQIASNYLAHRDALRQQRRAGLCIDVRKAVTELSRKGLPSTVNNVIPLLSEQAAKDWNLIRQEIDHSTRELTRDALEA